MDHRVAKSQKDRDLYFMTMAEAAMARANCKGTEVGAVLVRGERIVATGYNGTPAGFDNCRDGGCLRCSEREKKDRAKKNKKKYESKLPETLEGKALDICFCVHAEQNTLLSSARHGISVQDGTLYVTHKPCFSCLKESVQAGIRRIVYLQNWDGAKSKPLLSQYEKLTKSLESTPGVEGFQQLDHKTYAKYRDQRPRVGL